MSSFLSTKDTIQKKEKKLKIFQEGRLWCLFLEPGDINWHI